MLNQDIANPVLNKNEYTTQALSKCVKEYVLSSNETHSIREFIELAFEYANLDVVANTVEPLENKHQVSYSLRNNHQPVIVVSKEFYRPADVELLCGNSHNIRRELSWKPLISFKELVRRMVINDINLLTNK